jgi:hypothetical protein
MEKWNASPLAVKEIVNGWRWHGREKPTSPHLILPSIHPLSQLAIAITKDDFVVDVIMVTGASFRGIEHIGRFGLSNDEWCGSKGEEVVKRTAIHRS